MVVVKGSTELDPAGDFQQEQLAMARHMLASRRAPMRGIGDALDRSPNNAGLLTRLGFNYAKTQEYELAAETFRKALASDPTYYWASVGLGECYRELGQFAKAAELYEALFRGGIHTVLVLGNLSGLPRSLVKVDYLSAIDELRSESGVDREALESQRAFIKASALDKAERYSEAWAQLISANDRRQQLLERENPGASGSSAEARELLALEGRTPLAGRNVEEGVPHTLFILGSSQTGKTTVEALVDALSGVRRGFENSLLNDIFQALRKAGLPTGRRFEAMAPAGRAMFRELYVEELAKYGKVDIHTNTRPGLIAYVLGLVECVPNARFIFVKRDIDDVAIRIYMKTYEHSHSYAYTIDTIYGHLRWYNEMIDRLAEKLPDITRVVQYEKMIEDPRTAVNFAADLCGVPAHEGPLPQPGDDRGCAEPYKQFMREALAGGVRRQS